jgi:hypothetical protein
VDELGLAERMDGDQRDDQPRHGPISLFKQPTEPIGGQRRRQPLDLGKGDAAGRVANTSRSCLRAWNRLRRATWTERAWLPCRSRSTARMSSGVIARRLETRGAQPCTTGEAAPTYLRIRVPPCLLERDDLAVSATSCLPHSCESALTQRCSVHELEQKLAVHHSRSSRRETQISGLWRGLTLLHDAIAPAR